MNLKEFNDALEQAIIKAREPQPYDPNGRNYPAEEVFRLRSLLSQVEVFDYPAEK